MASIPRVVLVDDRPEDRKAAVRVLDAIANVITAADSSELDAAIGGGPVDVLIAEQATIWTSGVDAAGADSGNSPSAPAPRATVLLVDDEPAVRLFVQRTLESAGYRVVIAETAELAIAHVDDPAFAADVLLSDVVMPDTDGAALALALRAKRPSLRVVLMSGYSEASGKRIIARVDGAKFVSKPFIPATLVAAIEEVLR